MIHKDVAHAEWEKLLRSRYDVSVNVYVDRYVPYKDGTVDADVTVAVIRPAEFDKVLAHGSAKQLKVTGKPAFKVLEGLLSEALDQCRDGIVSVK